MANPKKSKAFIITFIAIFLLLLVGYFLFSNRGTIFSTEGINVGKIFEPLIDTLDRKDVDVITDPSQTSTKLTARAGEDIPKGGQVYVVGTNVDGNPIVMNYTSDMAGLGINPIGIAEDYIGNGDLGNIIINDPNLNNEGDQGLWDIISNTFGNIVDSIFGGGDNGEETTPPPYIYDPNNNNPFSLPTVTVLAEPASIAPGESSTISWTSTNTTSCDAGEGNGTDVFGNFSTGILNESKSFTVTCIGEKGMSSGSVIIMVNTGNGGGGTGGTGDGGGTGNGGTDGGEFTFPTVTVLAEPISIEPGETSNISWTSTNTTSCDAGEGNGTDVFGNFSTGILNESKSFTVTCIGEKGTGGGNAFVIVIPTYTGFSVCSDGIDNDGNDDIDIADPECHSDGNPNNPDSYVETHYSENTRPNDGFLQCSNKIDDDSDGLIDEDDPQCHTDGDVENPESYNRNHYSEKPIDPYTYSPQCSDTIDNDGDELIDAYDPGCHTDFTATNTESYDRSISWEARTQISPECSDGIDNGDEDTLADIEDPECHDDGDAENPESYNPNIGSEEGVIPINNGECTNGAINPPECDEFPDNQVCINGAINYPICDDIHGNDNTEVAYCSFLDQYPLEFTDSEKAKLAELLRKFYLIAPTLKTEDDISLTYNEIERYKVFVSQVEELIGMCEIQKNDPGYLGPMTTLGNPWYREYDRDSYTAFDLFGRQGSTNWVNIINSLNSNSINTSSSGIDRSVDSDGGIPIAPNVRYGRRTDFSNYNNNDRGLLIEFEYLLNIW